MRSVHIEHKVVESIQDILDVWDVRYDESESKYIASTNSNHPISPEALERMRYLGLNVFSIRNDFGKIIVKFSSGCSF